VAWEPDPSSNVLDVDGVDVANIVDKPTNARGSKREHRIRVWAKTSAMAIELAEQTKYEPDSQGRTCTGDRER